MPAWWDKLVGERVSVRSPIPFPEAVRWLGAAVTEASPQRATIRLRSTAPTPNSRDLPPPVLRGRLVPDGAGCRFDGVIVLLGHSRRARQVGYLRSWITGALAVPYFGARRTQD
ncbi:hypothetical protein HH310_37660 [Actinoplanes sp. TBRC 11911]|uniref:hypothetical protein n=1 Tax=Actinoplanes sp. TBRC 11911 TaxID=2729386 RepID=UPI00145CA230|nr:hypothetical protein [Actinoplanes sp. TBRC 11911]NMO56888.1 hypothetical protein [Actinoplanes sp. TBRC 11911]